MSQKTTVRWRRELDTNIVRVGTQALNRETDYVELKDGIDTKGVFKADVYDTRGIIDAPIERGSIQVNPRLSQMFDISVDSAREKIAVSPVDSLSGIKKAKEIKIFGQHAIPDQRLKTELKRQNYLIHPIVEKLSIGGQDCEFVIVTSRPSIQNWKTLVITSETNIRILTKDDLSQQKRDELLNRFNGNSPQSDKSEKEGKQNSTESGHREEDYPLTSQEPEKSFDDLAGLNDIKSDIQARIELAKDGSLADNLKDDYGEALASRGQAMLLYGPPGCGKTDLAEAIAYEFMEAIESGTGDDVSYFDVKATRVLSKYKGESEEQVEKMFEQAELAANNGYSVMVLDEVETLIQDRSEEHVRTHQKQLTNQFLREMNSISENMMVIGATNHPFNIDPAASRRFPKKIFVEHPSPEVLAEIWRKKLSDGDKIDTSAIDFQELGEASADFTPAEIINQIIGDRIQSEVVHRYISGDPVELTQDYLLKKIEESTPRTIKEYTSQLESHVIRNQLQGYDELEEYIIKNTRKNNDDTEDNKSEK